MWRAAASRLLVLPRPTPPSPAAANAMSMRRNNSLRLLSPQPAAEEEAEFTTAEARRVTRLVRLLSPQPAAEEEAEFTTAEARRVARLVGVEALKRRLRKEGQEVVGYGELLDACVEAGAARTHVQAEALARAMDQSGVLLLFRGKAYLKPDKLVDLVIISAVPPVHEAENDMKRQEFKRLRKQKEEMDRKAQKQVRAILWSGYGLLMTQVEMCFRFTFWEFSWTVMGPVTFFAGSSFLLADYAYFLVTSSDLSYRGFMERLFLARRTKLYAKHGFDMEKYLEMERQLRCPLGGDHSQAATKAIFEEIERRLRDGRDDQVAGNGEELLGALLESGLVRTEAEALIRGMEENRLALLVQGKAYLNHKVVGLIRRAVPFALAPENDARKEEFKQLQEKMQEIDGLAQKHARRVLRLGLAYFVFQFVLFFRLTFWEFNWSVMEPIAFFAAGIQLILCYGYFLITSSNPTLKDLMQRLVLTRRRKLCAKRSFDMDRYLELQKHSR